MNLRELLAMNGLTFIQLCHAISLTLFVHWFYAIDSSSLLQSSLVPISFMANDYRNNSWTQQHITQEWLNTTTCPKQCHCAYALSTFVSKNNEFNSLQLISKFSILLIERKNFFDNFLSK